MQWLCAEYTEVWISSPVASLINLADKVRSIASTGLDLVGLTEGQIDPAVRERFESFDEIVSWYGAGREEFRSTINQLAVPCRFLPALPPPENKLHAADFFSLQVGAPMGCDPKLTLPLNNERRNTIAIHPFSGSARKNWSLQRYQELANRLPLPVEWIAGPEEALPHAHRFPQMNELAAWLSGARLFIGNDSGITHLAAALGVPTVALFGPTNPDVWAPRGDHVGVLQHQPLDTLSVDSVFQRCTIEAWN